MTGVASAQATADQSLRDELAQINASLKDIANTLKQQAETQQADLLLKRATFAATQLSAAEERLKRIDQDARTLRGQSGEYEMMAKRRQSKTPPEELSTEAGEQLAEMKERLVALGQERITAENEIVTLRRDEREWRALLDKFLTSRLPSPATH